jgi:hypothetical protein
VQFPHLCCVRLGSLDSSRALKNCLLVETAANLLLAELSGHVSGPEQAVAVRGYINHGVACSHHIFVSAPRITPPLRYVMCAEATYVRRG